MQSPSTRSAGNNRPVWFGCDTRVFLGLLHCMKKNALGFVSVGVLLVIGSFVLKSPKNEQRQALVQRKAATYVLGKFLATKYYSDKVLIASNPFSQISGRPREIYQFETAGIDG